MSAEERCMGYVPQSGLMAPARCRNKAKPDSCYCGQHEPKVADTSQARDPLGPPKVATATQRTRYATLSWTVEDGPVVQVPYTAQMVVLTELRFAQTQGHNADVRGAAGIVLKKDGTPGLKVWRERFGLKLPESVAKLGREALEGVAW